MRSMGDDSLPRTLNTDMKLRYIELPLDLEADDQ